MAGFTYKDAGVDIEAGERLVDRIKPLAAMTRTAEVLGGVGGFAGLCNLPTDIEDPVLVSGTDGVGTKLKLAFLLDRHDSVGIDLVAMCVNDVLTVGARPLFFLDYFATGTLDVDRAEQVIKGIAEGCKQAGCALLGGETAELPGFYAAGEYDLAGFAVGVVGRKSILDGSRVRPGDRVLGVASSGLHSNGYSLARKALLEGPDALPLEAPTGQLGEPLGDALLRPTRIYARAAQAAITAGPVSAFCHVTGGGLPGNLPRVLPAGLGVEVAESRWAEPPIFALIAERAGTERQEMRRTFNMGVGLVVICPEDGTDAITAALTAAGETVWDIGRVVDMPGVEGEARVRYLDDDGSPSQRS